MKIVSDFAGDYKDGYNTSLKMEEFSDDGDEVFFYGIQCGIDKKYLNIYKDYKRKILLDLWSPCAFFTDPNHFLILDGFDEVYSICPYTCDWTNSKLGKELMKYCYYPVSPHIVEPTDDNTAYKKLTKKIMRYCFPSALQDVTPSDHSHKIYDVCYVGGIYSQEHELAVDIISRYNYIFITQSPAKKATHRFLSNADKMKFVGKSKIGICFNKLYPNKDHLKNIRTYADWQSNVAFSNLSDLIPICPQMKTRVHEFALSRTLILCHRDPWNIIEDFYEPGKDFIYFENIQDLNELIPEILGDWDSYQGVIDNAYRKVSKYFTGNLVKMVQDESEFSTHRIKGS